MKTLVYVCVGVVRGKELYINIRGCVYLVQSRNTRLHMRNTVLHVTRVILRTRCT